MQTQLVDRVIAVLEDRKAQLKADIAKLAMRSHPVKTYRGYTQSAYRLCFNYEDKYSATVPELQTILPTGVVESRKVLHCLGQCHFHVLFIKVLEPKVGKGLLCYAYSQSMESKAAALPHLDSPFVWAREDDSSESYALVQAWSVRICKLI